VRYTTEDLIIALQTSEHELLELLNELHAFQDADGSWRVLSPTYETRVFRDMLDAVVENDWPAHTAPGVPIAQFQASSGALSSDSRVAIRQCCLTYGSVNSEKSDERCVLDATKVAVFCAMGLFDERAAERRLAQQHSQFQTASLPMAAAGGSGDSESDQGWDLAHFVDKWQLRVPTGVKVHADMLRGLVLKRRKGIVYFPEHTLPTDPKKRFDALFAAQDKWTVQEMEPFIKYVARYWTREELDTRSWWLCCC
jgi:sister chromatid cohesion protein DCC1